jgi:electron transfer flavoprotein beta subunit
MHSFSLKILLHNGYYTMSQRSKRMVDHMKVLVGVQRVIDYKTHIRIKADQTGIETANVKMAMNPFDEIAVEEAVRLKEKGIATEVVVLTIGVDACQEILRTALAMGADRAIHVQTDQKIQSLAAAKILQAVAVRETPDLIILGKQAIDNDNNQTGQMLAGLLNWAQGTFASKLEIETGKATVTREVDGGLETLELKLPAVVTTDLRLNEPRYISLPSIVQAKRKTITVLPLLELSVDIAPRLKVLTVTPPEQRAKGIKVNNILELLSKLKNEARVLS